MVMVMVMVVVMMVVMMMTMTMAMMMVMFLIFGVMILFTLVDNLTHIIMMGQQGVQRVEPRRQEMFDHLLVLI